MIKMWWCAIWGCKKTNSYSVRISDFSWKTVYEKLDFCPRCGEKNENN